MKPVDFEYARADSIAEAVRLLGENPDAKVLAGGQTLGPMLNLRLAQPALLIDITRIPELAQVREDADAITLGATITHAAIEDGRVPDPTGGLLAQVAAGIAYRAVRSRGTIGGSLAHADPAADWVSCLTALDAEILIAGAGGSRRIGIAQFVRGAMATALAADELITGVRIGRFSRTARFGYHKICRKAGEFAEAIGVVAHDPDCGVSRLVCSTPAGAPLVIPHADAVGDHDATSLKRRLRDAGLAGDTYELNVHAAALQRAIRQAQARP